MSYNAELNKCRLEELVVKGAERFLQNEAVVFTDEQHSVSLTYSKLLEISTAISKLLIKNCALNQVIMCINKASILTPSFILGILQANSYFSFIDLRNPLEFIKNSKKYIFIKFFLIEADVLEILRRQKKLNLTVVDELFSEFNKIVLLKLSTNNENKNDTFLSKNREDLTDKALAYMIQTSGTTGQPKVVFVPHRCIVPNILHLRSIFEVHPEDNIIQLSPLTFDPSIVEIFLALTSGASIIFLPEQIKAMPKKLSLTLKKQNITIMQATPTLVSNFGIEILKESILSESSSLRILAFGGEECPLPSSINKWKSENNSTRFFNLYGITEVSCWSTYCEIFPEDLLCVNKITQLGKCLVGTEVQLLNEENLEIDYGEGELYIGGVRQCFINEEIQIKNLNKQMRATGDWVYKKESGDLFFIKRTDSVVKHNGKKINIAFIENNIRKLTFVNCCSTFYHKEEKLLYVFIIPVDKQKELNQIEMEIFKIFKFEPSATIPFVVQVIYSFPQTTHGKLDYEALINYVKCKKKRKNMEDFNIREELLTLWKKYTGLTSINATENHQFIYDGGDSIGAVQLSKEIEWYIGNNYPLLIEKLLNCTLQDVLNYLIEFNDQGKRILPEYESADPRLVKRSKINNFSGEIKDLDERNTLREHPKMCDKNESRSCFHVFSKRGIVKRCVCLLCSDTLNLSNKENFNSVSIKCIWNYDLEKCIDASPLIIKDLRDYTTAFIGSHSGQFVAVDIKNGKKLWEVVLNGRIESSACISYCGNFIAVGCYDFSIYCLEKTTGKVHWRITTGAEVKCSPISDCFKNVLYCGSHDKYLYAININTGIIIWKQKNWKWKYIFVTNSK